MWPGGKGLPRGYPRAFLEPRAASRTRPAWRRPQERWGGQTPAGPAPIPRAPRLQGTSAPNTRHAPSALGGQISFLAVSFLEFSLSPMSPIHQCHLLPPNSHIVPVPALGRKWEGRKRQSVPPVLPWCCRPLRAGISERPLSPVSPKSTGEFGSCTGTPSPAPKETTREGSRGTSAPRNTFFVASSCFQHLSFDVVNTVSCLGSSSVFAFS